MKPQSIAKTVDRIHALEMHELELVEPGYVWKPYDCRYDLMNAESRTACFTNLNVTRFLDFGDRYRQILGPTLFVGFVLRVACCVLCVAWLAVCPPFYFLEKINAPSIVAIQSRDSRC